MTFTEQDHERADLHSLERGSGSSADRSPCISGPLRAYLGGQLQSLYAPVMSEVLPAQLLGIIARLEDTINGHEVQGASEFREGLIAALPQLRGFAHSLTMNANRADDLVQETVLKAWKNQHCFRPGTSLNAWLFTILRNQFYTECRKAKREVEDADGAAAARLTSLPDQEDRIEAQQVWEKLAKLPPLQREALLLIGMHGMTYEAAAEVLGCETGTVKSRVSRARAVLSESLGFADGRLSRASA
jgi:RNA polymerase sigma-70 factor (ECF subfamily)